MPDLLLSALHFCYAPIETLQKHLKVKVVDHRPTKHFRVWHEFYECKSATQRGVQELDAPVGRIHRPEDEHVWRNRERFPALREADRHPPLVALQQRDEFTEDLGDVAAIDLVDQQEKRLVWPRGRGAAHPLEDAGLQPQRKLTRTAVNWLISLHQVLVRVRRVEGHTSQVADIRVVRIERRKPRVSLSEKREDVLGLVLTQAEQCPLASVANWLAVGKKGIDLQFVVPGAVWYLRQRLQRDLQVIADMVQSLSNTGESHNALVRICLVANDQVASLDGSVVTPDPSVSVIDSAVPEELVPRPLGRIGDDPPGSPLDTRSCEFGRGLRQGLGISQCGRTHN